MNQEEERPFDPESAIDRLVCGEAVEDERRTLLAWLEEEPVRWRRFGLAFLEAQAWTEAMHRPAELPTTVASPEPPREGISRLRRAGLWMAVAASLVVSFGLGTLRPRGPLDSRRPEAEQNRTDVVESRPGDSNATRGAAALGAEVLAASLSAPEPTEYERQIWERYGYRVRRECRFISAKLADGREVMVPVERNVADCVGVQVY